MEDAGFDRTELNVTYVPVKTPLPKGRPSPEWVLEHYSYPRSQFFLSRLPGTYRRGPYLVSVLRPISRAHGETGSHLVQNISAIPPNRTDFIHKWIRGFMERAGLPEKWNEATGAGLADELRLAVAQAAEGLPKVQEAIKSWIVWIKNTYFKPTGYQSSGITIPLFFLDHFSHHLKGLFQHRIHLLFTPFGFVRLETAFVLAPS